MLPEDHLSEARVQLLAFWKKGRRQVEAREWW